jgi:hypothetical protein
MDLSTLRRSHGNGGKGNNHNKNNINIFPCKSFEWLNNEHKNLVYWIVDGRKRCYHSQLDIGNARGQIIYHSITNEIESVQTHSNQTYSISKWICLGIVSGFNSNINILKFIIC